MDWDEVKERNGPLAAGAAGFLLMIVWAFFFGAGITVAFSSSAIQLIFVLALGFLACRLVAQSLEVHFGERQEAAIKLGGILAASAGIWHVIPWVGWLAGIVVCLLGIVVCLLLLKWIYELDRTPLIATTVGMSAGIWLGLYIGGKIAGWLNTS